MDFSRCHFNKNIDEAKTAIKLYSKVHYFIRLIRPRRIKNDSQYNVSYIFYYNCLAVFNYTPRLSCFTLDRKGEQQTVILSCHFSCPDWRLRCRKE